MPKNLSTHSLSAEGEGCLLWALLTALLSQSLNCLSGYLLHGMCQHKMPLSRALGDFGLEGFRAGGLIGNQRAQEIEAHSGVELSEGLEWSGVGLGPVRTAPVYPLPAENKISRNRS